MMTKNNLIAKQAMKIARLSADVKILNERIRKAQMQMTCIGGPLNDNKLMYTKEQLVAFHRIKQDLGQ